MTTRTSMGETPFSLIFGVEVVVLVEIGFPSPRVEHLDVDSNNESLRLNLDMLEESRETTYFRVAKYKSCIVQYYNSKVKHRAFKADDLILKKVM